MSTNIKEKLMQAAGKVLLTVEQNKPEILLGLGIAGIITSAVLACRATLKVNDILDDAKQRIDEIHNSEIVPTETPNVSVVSSNVSRDLAKVYLYFGVRVIKLYVPSLLLGAASIGSIVGSAREYKQRNISLASAYFALSEEVKEIRARMKGKLGEQAANELRYGVEEETYTEEVIDENGEATTVERTKKVVKGSHYNPYVRILDESWPCWIEDRDGMLYILKQWEETFTADLRCKHYLTLNQVLELMGLPTTREGQDHGWVWTPGKRVELGIFDPNGDKTSEYLRGKEHQLVIEFNCDGYIKDTVWPKEKDTLPEPEEEEGREFCVR